MTPATPAPRPGAPARASGSAAPARVPARATSPPGKTPAASIQPGKPASSSKAVVPSKSAASMQEPPSNPAPRPAFLRQRPEPNPVGDFTRSVYEVARKEVLQHIRTKRLLIIGIAMAVLLVTVTLGFGPNIMRTFDDNSPNAQENTILAFYFGFALIGGLVFTQLLAIVLTSDAVCSEWSNRTIFLLLSKPVSRVAFVVGKFLGNVAVLAGTIFVLFTFVYLAMQPFYDGAPTGEEVGAFFLTILLIILGCMAYAAMALFFSTLTKSTIMSTLITLAMWIIVLPLVGSLGFFTHLGDPDAGEESFFDSDEVQRTLYFNPASDMQAVVPLLLPHDGGEFKEVVRFLNFFNPAPNQVDLAVLSLAAYTVVFFAASIAVVQRRNFE